MEMVTTLILLYLLIIIIVSLWASKKTGVADVLFYLIGGLLAVNLHLLSPKSETVETFAFIGTIFLFFYLGLEENLEGFSSGVKKGWKIAVAGVIVPFISIYTIEYALSHDTIKAIVFAMAFAPTSIGIAFLTLNTLSFGAKSKLQPIIVAAALTDDVISLILWGILGGVLVSLQNATTTISLGAITSLAVQPISNFLYFSLAMGFITLISRIKTKRNLGHQDINTAIIIMVLLAFLGSYIAEYFGTSIALGAYFVGLIINKEHFMIDSSGNHELFHQAIEKLRFLTLYFFAPIFFISIGLHMEIKSLSLFMKIFTHAFILALVLFIAQLSAAALTARYINNLPWRSSILIGIAMQGRAEVTFLVAIAALSMNLITSSDLLLISVTAFILNLSVPFLLKYAAHAHEKYDQAVM